MFMLKCGPKYNKIEMMDQLKGIRTDVRIERFV